MAYDLGLQLTFAVCLWALVDLAAARGPLVRRVPVMGAAVALALWMLGAMILRHSAGPDQVLLGRRVLFLGAALVPAFWLWMSAEAARARWPRRWPWILGVCAALPLACYSFLFWDDQGWYVSWTAVPNVRGPVFWLHAGCGWLLYAVAMGYFLVAARRLGRGHPLRLAAILAGSAIPLAGNMLFVLFGVAGEDPAPILLGVGFVIIRLAVLDSGIAALLPLGQRNVLEQLRSGVVVADLEGIVVDANAAARRLLGDAELVDQQLADLLERCREDPGRVVEVHSVPLWRGGSEAGSVALLTDRTEAARLERELLEAQKLESLGILAGGVAHDFRNLLTGILSSAGMARMELGRDHPSARSLDRVVEGSKLAAQLTDQLLAYAGKRSFETRPLDLSAELRAVEDLVESSLLKSPAGADVRLIYELGDGLPAIEADPTSVQQVLINLVLNAAKASEPGALVHVRTRTMDLREPDLPSLVRGHAVEPGRYVVLEVEDRGQGMDAATLDHIFEPFFTTRPGGHGLGLAATLGNVHGHGGGIAVASTPGVGSRFRVFFPLSARPLPAPAASAGAVPTRQEPAGNLSGHGRVLVVDDDPYVLDAVRATLENFGYGVRTARDGASALSLFRAQPTAIDLVVLDRTMPGMSGEETFRELRSVRPDVKVLWSTARPGDLSGRLASDGSVDFLAKPYEPDELARRVRSLLGAPGDAVERSTSSPSMDELRVRYEKKLPGKLEELARAIDRAGAADAGPEALEEARHLAHTLHGSAGSFGFDAVAEAACLVEDALLDLRDGSSTEVDWALLGARIEELRDGFAGS